MATYVLVHDAGHGGWCYQRVAALLRVQGHQVYTPSLTGSAERSHGGLDVGLDGHIREIAGLLWLEDLRDVILVGHGYGGMVITGAADRVSQRVGHLVYLDGATAANGQSLSDIAPAVAGFLRRYVEYVNGVELCLVPAPDIVPVCGVTDPATLEWMLPRLTPFPWRCFEQALRLNNEDILRTIPQSHAISALPCPGRNMDHLRDISEGRVWELRTGHDMMLTAPEQVADKLAATAEWLPARHDQ